MPARRAWPHVASHMTRPCCAAASRWSSMEPATRSPQADGTDCEVRPGPIADLWHCTLRAGVCDRPAPDPGRAGDRCHRPPLGRIPCLLYTSDAADDLL